MSATRDGEQILAHLQRLDDYEFEHFVADLWERQGWDAEVSQASVDAGVDVTATKETPYHQKLLIQAKRYGPNTTVGGPDIQQYASLKHQQGNVDKVAVVTTNRFTSHAENRAQELNVKTIDGQGLVALIDNLHAYDLLEKYRPADQGPSGTPGTTGDAASTHYTDSSLTGQSSSNSSSVSLRGILRGVLGFLRGISPDTYYRILQVGIVSWTIVFVLGAIDFSGGGVLGGILSIAAFVSWGLSPAGFYYEGGRVAEETNWSPYRRLFALVALFPFAIPPAGVVYLYLRKRAYETEEEPADPVAEPVVE